MSANANDSNATAPTQWLEANGLRYACRRFGGGGLLARIAILDRPVVHRQIETERDDSAEAYS